VREAPRDRYDRDVARVEALITKLRRWQMKRLSLWLIVGGTAVGLLLGIWIERGRPPRETQPLPAGVLRGANVLLVTIDTLRADHVGAYGGNGGVTPTIDDFAKTGLRFARAYAHVPLTLPSHATLMTASYPTRNGVHDNGTFHLGDASPTLAAALKSGGYRTAAFVGAFVLDARFGLNRGFDVYDDRLRGSSSDLDLVQRTADQVLAPAYDWIVNTASSERAPWFAWVHLYDPHEPYAPPEPFRSRYAGAPYDGEIAYADAALGHFVARLRAAEALTHTLVVIASDHGESLGEHGERTHGLFAYDATLRVPLVMWAGGQIRPAAFNQTMRLVDVAPTMLDLLGAEPLPRVDGRSVRPFIAGEQPFDDGGSYFEALNANLTRNWAPLTGILRERMKLIDLPVPELYDLTADPTERQNIYASQRDRARDLERRLDAVARGAAPPAPAALDADAEARLRSLGYVVGSAPKPARHYSAADDPKRLVHLNQALDDASAQWARGDAQRAIDELQAIITERPDFTVAYDRLAFMLRASGRVADAVAVLDRAAHAGHADRPLLRSLGSMLRDAGDLRRSAAMLEDLVRADATDLQSADALAQTYARMGRGEDAESQFKRVLAASPNDAAAWNNLGSMYLAGNRLAEARTALVRAIEIDPALAGAHNGLGVVYARSGDIPRAVAEWKKALELRPGLADARSNLDRVRQ
jgi:arylsulfatase A-like enzyme/Tfp pilus assembly protein PilF